MNDSKRTLWPDLWELDSDRVICRECHAAQLMEHGALAFNHESSCSRAGADEYPYRELLDVIHMMRYADAPLPTEASSPPWTPPKD